jgi:hypothetical protein
MQLAILSCGKLPTSSTKVGAMAWRLSSSRLLDEVNRRRIQVIESYAMLYSRFIVDENRPF